MSDMQRIDTDSTLAENDVCHELSKDGAVNTSNDGSFEAIVVQECEIWVGYMHQDRHFIERVQASSTTEMNLSNVRAWWETRVPSLRRSFRTIILCKRPIILIGLLPPVCKPFTRSVLSLC